MKITGIIFSFFLLTMLAIPGLSAAQVRVSEKPMPPKGGMAIPARTEDGTVLLPGRWVWHRPAKMYVWLSPVWVKPPRGKVWSPGYWKPLRENWIWVPGKWENKKRFWARNGN